MIKKTLTLLAALCFAPFAGASDGGHLLESHANVNDTASLQRGAKYFVNYCLSCHSASYVRFSRIAQDLKLDEAQVMQNLNFTGAKFGEPLVAAMAPADAERWFGKAPPDLSLTARAKPGGPDWIFTYLKSFYVDESRPSGWNNTLLVGASMPHILWEAQGLQRPVYDEKGNVASLHLSNNDSARTDRYDEMARDISNFMQYMAEPAALKRPGYGIWVMLFLALFTFIAWLLKREYWKDVH